MIHWPRVLPVAAFILSIPASAAAQQESEQSCGGTMTQQLRRLSEQCLSQLASFVASQPEMAATVYSESEKYYIKLVGTDDGLLAEAVSKFNYPLMKDETPETLKSLGWMPPSNEGDDWSKRIGRDSIRTGDAAKELSRALGAYGLEQGEAISLTVGPKLTDKPTGG